MADIITAIQSLAPDQKWFCKNEQYDSIEWDSSNKISKPTLDEINAEITRLNSEYTNNKYQRDRAAEYPSVVDQLDDIYHNGIDGWKATIKATKDKYPKP